MSYPPPPGAPQNPPQQPGYGPPPGGTPPGPPPPQLAGPGYQPPADPYAAPPGDPYALPAPGMPAGSGPPPPPMRAPGQQPPPRPKKSKLGWILGGVAVVVILAVAAVGFAVWGGGDSQGVIEAGQTEEDNGGDDAGGEETSDARYEVTSELCEDLDYSEIEKILDFDTPEGAPIGQGEVYCSSPNDDEGYVSLRAWQNADGEEGLSTYQSLLEEGVMINYEEIEGDWDNGEVSVSEHGGGLLAHSGNLVVLIDVYPSLDGEIDPEPTRAAVVALAESAFEVTAV